MVRKTKRVIAVHGGGVQPQESACAAQWKTALRAGLLRDWPDTVTAFDQTPFVMTWYADQFAGLHPQVDDKLDGLDRQASIDALSALTTTKAFRRANYERLPGKSALPEFVADIVAPTMGLLGLGHKAAEAAVPEFKSYWHDTEVANRIRTPIYNALKQALLETESVALITHGFGAVVAYDVLWELGEEMPDQKLDLWLTIGAPLADNSVRKQLRGADEALDRRLPANLFRWHNLAAEDDFMCHDKTIADDFSGLLRGRQISELVDHPIYNLAVRYGSSAPGFSAGYLVHPRMAEQLKRWLTNDND